MEAARLALDRHDQPVPDDAVITAIIDGHGLKTFDWPEHNASSRRIGIGGAARGEVRLNDSIEQMNQYLARQQHEVATEIQGLSRYELGNPDVFSEAHARFENDLKPRSLKLLEASIKSEHVPEGVARSVVYKDSFGETVNYDITGFAQCSLDPQTARIQLEEFAAGIRTFADACER